MSISDAIAARLQQSLKFINEECKAVICYLEALKMAQVMVVDDSGTVRDKVSEFLSKNDISVIVAVDGKDGLDKMKANPQIKLIISDINMPNMDGLTMVEKIRNELGNNGVNVIMLTTESDDRMKARGKAAGVKGWIVKPFKGEAVIGAIQKLIA